MPSPQKAQFTTGSTMRHVVVMTATGGVGLLAIFMVDALNLFYISLLGQVELAAAIGFAGTLQFFMISVSIGLSIAATAMVSRAVGAGQREDGRCIASSALLTLVSLLTVVSIGVWVMREEALALLGAEGETLAVASRFMAIVVPSMPLLGVTMVAGGLLRAVGDGRRAMWVTLSGGLIAAALDPLFIFGFGLGVDGAAVVSVLARIIMAGIGLRLAVGVHDLLGPLRADRMVADARGLMAIALPAVATQLSTPFGNAYLTRLVAEHGSDAVAGWAVVGRLSAVAFGAVFALSGAVGPILGQNYGAGLAERIRTTYRDALIFVAVYVLLIWALLWLATDAIVQAFGVTGAGIEVVSAFTGFGAGAFLFTGWLFVSNAVFNNLGHPTWSTGFNWSRDGLVIPLIAAVIAGSLGTTGVVAVQAMAAVLVGSAAAVAVWRFLSSLDLSAAAAAPAPPAAEHPAFASGRATLPVGDYPAAPKPTLAEPPERG